MSELEQISQAFSRLEEKVKQKQAEHNSVVAGMQQELDSTKSDYAELKMQMSQVLQKIDDIIAVMDK